MVSWGVWYRERGDRMSVIAEFTVPAGDFELGSALRGDEDARVELDRVDGAALFRVEWATGINGLIGSAIAHDGHVVGTSGTTTRWAFELRFDSPNVPSAFQTACRESGVSLDITRVHELERSGPKPDREGSTAAQCEVLVAVFERG